MPDQSVSFERAADYYDNTRGFPPGVETDVAALIARAGDFTPAARVLEIGVGTGRIALPVARHVGAYVGIDLARPMMERLRAKQTDEPIYPVEGDVTRLPFADASFDAVIAVHVFHLIPAWRDVLDEVARVLRPGAPLVHGWNGRLINDGLQEVWQAATHESREAAGAIPTEKRQTFLVENGWHARGEMQTHHFISRRTPQEFINSIRGRLFSSMWRMDDATLECGLAAVEAYAAVHYPDLNQPMGVSASFSVQAYLPPPR